MRSLLLTTSFLPTLGGVETLLYQTARRLTEPPLVVAPEPAAAPDLRVWSVRTEPRGLAGRAAYRAIWPLHPSLHYTAAFWQSAWAAARATRPEVLQCGHVYLAPLTRLLARRSGRPYVVYAHGQEVWRDGRGRGIPALDVWLRGRALADADALITHSAFTAGLLRAWGVPPERITCAPFGAEPRPPGPPPSGATLLSVGRLVPRKGIDTVIRALPHIAQRVPEVRYHVVGSGPDEARLRTLAADTGVAERVQFLGRLDDAALAREYQRCALFVLPTRRTDDGQLEGYGLVYFEAAAWGRAVVAGRSGGEADAVLDGVTGRLVDGTSVEAVATTITDLLTQPGLLHTLGAAGRQRVLTTHNWQSAAQVVDGVLARVMGRTG